MKRLLKKLSVFCIAFAALITAAACSAAGLDMSYLNVIYTTDDLYMRSTYRAEIILAKDRKFDEGAVCTTADSEMTLTLRQDGTSGAAVLEMTLKIVYNDEKDKLIKDEHVTYEGKTDYVESRVEFYGFSKLGGADVEDAKNKAVFAPIRSRKTAVLQTAEKINQVSGYVPDKDADNNFVNNSYVMEMDYGTREMKYYGAAEMEYDGSAIGLPLAEKITLKDPKAAKTFKEKELKNVYDNEQLLIMAASLLHAKPDARGGKKDYAVTMQFSDFIAYAAGRQKSGAPKNPVSLTFASADSANFSGAPASKMAPLDCASVRAVAQMSSGGQKAGTPLNLTYSLSRKTVTLGKESGVSDGVGVEIPPYHLLGYTQDICDSAGAPLYRAAFTLTDYTEIKI